LFWFLGFGLRVGAGGLSSAPSDSCPVFSDQGDHLGLPSSAGGVTDVSSRVIAKPLAAILGVPVIVDPRPGAGGIIATEFVANAKPDGYTILLATSGTIATNPWLYKKLTYDPIKSFKPVIALSEGSQLLVVPEASKFKTLKDLVAYAQANPGKLNFASAGAGTGQHLAMEMLKSVAGIDVAHVPFKGATPAQTALLGQDVDAAFDYPSSIRSNLEAGKLRALVALGEVRTKNAPDVPTLKESGYDATLTGWSSVVAPAGTPDDIVARLGDAIAKAQTDPDVVAYYEQNATRDASTAPGRRPDQVPSGRNGKASQAGRSIRRDRKLTGKRETLRPR
jgi:tripartite-type tricarboxylate transporter receptor subunit TctC